MVDHIGCLYCGGTDHHGTYHHLVCRRCTDRIAAALSLPLWLQILLFLAVSLVLLYLTRPVAVKYFNKDRVKTNAESLVGQQAIVISEIDNLQGIGQVTVGRQEWSARSTDDNKKLPVGSVVIIRAISGVKLIVEEKEMPLTGKENQN